MKEQRSEGYARKSERETDIWFESWHELIDALRTDYTLSLHDICRTMRASRRWVNQYIRPFIRNTYIRNNQRGDHREGLNWLSLVAKQIGRDPSLMTDLIWFHRADFEAYITQNIVSVTQQTKGIPVTYFMSANAASDYVSERTKMIESFRNGTYTGAQDFWITYELLHWKYIDKRLQTPALKLLFASAIPLTKRTQTPRIAVDLPENYLSNWKAISDIKDYGDTDEIVFRSLYKYGNIRIEVCLPDEAGQLSNKVFYMDDPDALECPYPYEKYFTVPLSAWQTYIASMS